MERQPGLDAELLDHAMPAVSERPQRVGLPSTPVEREHQLGEQTFAERVLRDQTLELGYHHAVPAERQVALDTLLQRRQPQLGEVGDGALGEGLIRELVECRSLPKPERSPQQVGSARHRRRRGPLDHGPKPEGVHSFPLDAQRVARRTRDEDPRSASPAALRLQPVTERGHQTVERLHGGGRRSFAPEPVEQAIGRDHLTRPQHEHCQKHPGPPPRQRDRATADQHLERTKDAKVRCHANRRPTAVLTRSRAGPYPSITQVAHAGGGRPTKE